MEFDVIVIGSGPGGYIAAIRCAQLGLNTAIIEKYDTLGGTCLNVGCIPSKALLDSSEHFFNASHTFSTHGIDVNEPKVNWPQMIKRKAEVVSQTCLGVASLMRKNKIHTYNGVGSIITPTKVAVTKSDGTKEELSTKKIIIATGSKPSSLPTIAIDKQRIITSTEALTLPELPKSLAVIGGGVIGMELGSVYARLGTKVTIIEYMDRLIPTMDKDLGSSLQRALRPLKMDFKLGHKVLTAKINGSSVNIQIEDKQGNPIEINSDYCLVSVGRKPFTGGLGLANVGIETTEKGIIPVDKQLRTEIPNIFAIGDVIAGPMLAHKAEEEGVYVAEIIAGQKPHLNCNTIPGVVYTWPEVASVGFTEEELIRDSRPHKVGSFPFRASARARASMDIEGLIKVIADSKTDEILGVHMVGPRAADMIGEAVVAMEFRASAEDIDRICHAHPTYSEALKEACLAASNNRPLNI